MTPPRKLVDNVADEEQVKRGVSKERMRQRRDDDAWLAQLATEDGRRVIWRILEECGAFRSAMERSDSLTNYNVGRQSIGQYLLAVIHKTRPEALIQMMTEHQKEIDA